MFPIIYSKPYNSDTVLYIGLQCPNCEQIMRLSDRVVLDNTESHICGHCGYIEECVLVEPKVALI